VIRVRLEKRLSEFRLQLELNVVPAELAALFGPSGAGKTTLLRCLAGLTTPDSGLLRVNDAIWFDATAKINLPPQQRRVGYMFQDYALFPNMTVRGNLEFALRKGADKKRIAELLDLMELGELQHRKPDALSGGQKQRVALARALVCQPDLLLLDEPLSALDPVIRSRLQDELLRLQRHFGLTTVMVSHDVAEVYKLASQVFVIENGVVARSGSPGQVFTTGQSQTSGKFRFTGEVLAIEPMDVLFAVTVLVGNQVVRVVATHEEAVALRAGDRVMLVSKAFNPMVLKLDGMTGLPG
jgi:molybdate transport system ATP-binding protein